MNFYGEERLALRANLHTHTTHSDGHFAPQSIIRLYANEGYDVLALTDHRQVHDISPYDPCGMILIQGAEIHPDNPGNLRWHILCLNLPLDFKYAAPPDQYRQVGNTDAPVQEVIDAVNAAGGVAAVAHPYWCQYGSEMVKKVKNYFAMEVYNTECRGIDKAYSVQTWDELLLQGYKVNAIAVDDIHGPGALFGGWTVICAKERTRESVMEALREGAFYASQGPEFRSLAVDGTTVTAEFSDVVECCFLAGTGRRAIACDAPLGPGSRMGVFNSASVDVSTLKLREVPKGENFVRCHIRDAKGRHAWSNPVYL